MSVMYTFLLLLENAARRAKAGQMTTSDKIDRIVTNRILALPIFAVIMWLVYYVSVTTVGTIVTDWTNDVLFGEIVPPAVEGFLTMRWLCWMAAESDP